MALFSTLIRARRGVLSVLAFLALGTLFAYASAVEPLSASAQAAGARTIQFSGFDWQVKSSAERVGPGPNYFSDSTDNVWVDPAGRLHLRITNRGGRWYTGEVFLTRPLGYGTYVFELSDPVDNLDPNAVLGLFTYADDFRELDIEFSRWGHPSDQNAQYVVQPAAPQQVHRFDEPARLQQSTHSFTWDPGRVLFQSVRGPHLTPPNPQQIIQSWTAPDGVPPALGDERVHMNLWLFQGAAPGGTGALEVVVRRFAFLPTP